VESVTRMTRRRLWKLSGRVSASTTAERKLMHKGPPALPTALHVSSPRIPVGPRDRAQLCWPPLPVAPLCSSRLWKPPLVRAAS
jgi:hypothetical protein